MQFKDVIGLQPVKNHLVDLVQNNRLSHALLFLGKEGSGSLAMALAFAQYIVCNSAKKMAAAQNNLFALDDDSAQNNVAIDACGVCAACMKAQQFIHPDIHFSFPVITKKSGTPPVSDDYMSEWREFISSHTYGNVYDWLQFIHAENKQGNITAEECNQINKKLSLKAFESEYKILIMWMPEFLGNAGNKLLKLIEEPPPDTLFIFVAQDEHAILPTILSRTQLVKIPLPEIKDVKQALIKDAGASEEKALQVATLSDGNYREALQMLQSAEHDWQRLIREWLNLVVKNNVAAQVKWIDEISQLGREKQKQFLKYFIHLLGQAVRVYFLYNEGSGVSENEMDFAQRLNKLCSIEAQEAMINELDKAIFYIERNAHAKMLFHALSIRLHYIIKDNSVILVH